MSSWDIRIRWGTDIERHGTGQGAGWSKMPWGTSKCLSHKKSSILGLSFCPPPCWLPTWWKTFEFKPKGSFGEQWLAWTKQSRCKWPFHSGKCFVAQISHCADGLALWVWLWGLLRTLCSLSDHGCIGSHSELCGVYELWMIVKVQYWECIRWAHPQSLP